MQFILQQARKKILWEEKNTKNWVNQPTIWLWKRNQKNPTHSPEETQWHILGRPEHWQPRKVFQMQIKLFDTVFRGTLPDSLFLDVCMWLLHSFKLLWMVILPVHAVYMQSIPQKDKIHYQVLQYLVYKYWLLHLLRLNKGFQVTDTLSHLKAKPRRNPLKIRLDWMCMKKRLRKYKSNEQ